jgi:hypothetical protein
MGSNILPSQNFMILRVDLWPHRVMAAGRVSHATSPNDKVLLAGGEESSNLS